MQTIIFSYYNFLKVKFTWLQEWLFATTTKNNNKNPKH